MTVVKSSSNEGNKTKRNGKWSLSMLSSNISKRNPFLRITSKRTIRWILLGLLLLYSLIQFLLYASPDHHHNSHYTIETAKDDIYRQLNEFREMHKKKTDGKSSIDTLNNIKKQKLQVQKILLRTLGRRTLPLKAFVEEEPLPQQKHIKPLPIRDHIQLKEYTYPNVDGCVDLQNRLPVDHPKDEDSIISPIVGNLKPIFPMRYEYASKYCPVDADPYLPWLHDVFMSLDNAYIDFVAHNKRRCRSSPNFRHTDLTNLEPQIALMQSVPIKRIHQHQQQQQPQNGNATSTTYKNRYRLASIEEADDDAKETRFICQFHTLRPAKSSSSNTNNDDEVEKIIIGETLSIFPYNYEHANYRKGPPNPNPLPMLTRPVDDQDKKGAHNDQIWNSILHFRCPVPDKITRYFHDNQQANDINDIDDEIPTFYVDLVPIRTPPRETKEGYCPQLLKESSFDPLKEWGTNHILPRVEDSGRWANIPICRPRMSSSTSSSASGKTNEEEETNPRSEAYKNQQKQIDTMNDKPKNDYLVGCLWASAAFSTRGTVDLDKSTLHRLLEWLMYHLHIAKFDHIYIYDNSEAHIQNVSLQPVIDMFPSNRVTRIPWKHRICNNNRPMHPNIGERSSQYAAEASCRLRYGPTTTWLISFDADEYLIPQANWTDIKAWLIESVKNGGIGPNTHVLSFFQTRALPNIDYMEPHKGFEPECRNTNVDNCLAKKSSTTFLEAYDCEKTPLPKPDYGWRAKKQIYRPEFVLNHFVHYTVATRRLLEAPEERSAKFMLGRPYERRVDELKEAFMLHTKTTSPTSTKGWKHRCKNADRPEDCPVGIPFPTDSSVTAGKYDQNGFAYNCYKHDRIQNSLKQNLEKLLQPLQRIIDSSMK